MPRLREVPRRRDPRGAHGHVRAHGKLSASRLTVTYVHRYPFPKAPDNLAPEGCHRPRKRLRPLTQTRTPKGLRRSGGAGLPGGSVPNQRSIRTAAKHRNSNAATRHPAGLRAALPSSTTNMVRPRGVRTTTPVLQKSTATIPTPCCWRPGFGQGCLRAARPRKRHDHARSVCPRHAGNAGRSGGDVRRAAVRKSVTIPSKYHPGIARGVFGEKQSAPSL